MLNRRSTSLLRAATVGAGATVAQTKQFVKIAAIYPLTGSASFLGVPEERALRMKVDEVDKAGSFNGKTLEVIAYDTEGNTNKAAQQLPRLAESDKVDIIFGPSSSGESLASIRLANELKGRQITHRGTEQIIKPTASAVAVVMSALDSSDYSTLLPD